MEDLGTFGANLVTSPGVRFSHLLRECGSASSLAKEVQTVVLSILPGRHNDCLKQRWHLRIWRNCCDYLGLFTS